MSPESSTPGTLPLKGNIAKYNLKNSLLNGSALLCLNSLKLVEPGIFDPSDILKNVITPVAIFNLKYSSFFEE